VSGQRLASIAIALALSACSARDAETDEAAIASDSAAATASIAVSPPDSAGPAPVAGRGLKSPVVPADKTPSVPRPTLPGEGVMADAPLDTARGVVAVVGADPMTRVTLRGDPRGTLTLAGPSSLSTLSGLELWVAGRQRDGVYEVKEFAVRAADGVPAIDGILTERAGALSLVRADGRLTAIASAPAAIRAFIGKRVWVTLLGGEVTTFGVVGPPT
jgi:hypothetical protein